MVVRDVEGGVDHGAVEVHPEDEGPVVHEGGEQGQHGGDVADEADGGVHGSSVVRCVWY